MGQHAIQRTVCSSCLLGWKTFHFLAHLYDLVVISALIDDIKFEIASVVFTNEAASTTTLGALGFEACVPLLLRL